MKYRGKRLGSMLLCAALVAALLPARASAAFEHMEVERKLPTSSVNHEERIQNLKDGEVYTYTEASLRDPAGNALPDTDFSVSLAAVGQKYPTTTTTVRPTVTVLVLDTSNSMKEAMGDNKNKSRMTALKESAKSFVDAVVTADNRGTNYVAVVTYATRSYKTLNFTNNKTTLTNKITQVDYQTGDDGGTNTHGGLIAAYKMISNPKQYGLSQEQLKNAVYSVVFMSDGAPTFYTALQAKGKNTFSTYNKTAAAIENTSAAYNALAFDDGNSGVLTRGTYKSDTDKDYTLYVGGPGTETNSNTVDNAKAAAVILKQISATPSVYSIYLKNSDYSKAQETMDAIASSKKESFTPEKTTELTETFQNIAVSIKSQAMPPIAEVEKDGALAPVSYVDMSYNLGSGFTLVGNTMQVSLGDKLYTFTRQTNGSYKGTDTGLEKLEIAVKEGVVNFRVPASLLPCNEPTPAAGAKTVAEPIKLFFTLRIDATKVNQAGEYPTARASTAKFYPTAENPFYYGGPVVGEKEKLAENVTVMDKKTAFYAAMYSNPGTNSYSNSNPPQLKGFAVGESSGTLVYQNEPALIKVSQYSDSTNASNDTMTLIYQDQSISFIKGKISFKTARADFSTTNDSNPGAYTVSNFSDGTAVFADAVVSSVSNGSGAKKNITVSYDGGKRTIEFKDVSLSRTTIYGSTPITAEFKGVYGSNNYIQTLTVVRVNGNTLTPSIIIPNAKEDSWSSGYDYFKNIIIEISGKEYLFDTIKMSYLNSPSYADATGKEILGYRDAATSVQSTYYYAETDVSVDVPRKLVNYQFDTSVSDTLKVQTRANGVGDWSTMHTHIKSANTEIVLNQHGGYTVTSIVGSTRTIVIYSIENDTLYRHVTTETVAEIEEGWVTQSHTEFGSITLTVKLAAGDIITSATLTSLGGTNMAVANSSGSADLLLTLAISGEVSGISGLNLTEALKLSVKAGESMPSMPFSYQVKGVKRDGVAVADYSGSLVPGVYQITLSTKSVYSDPKLKPGSATVSLDQIRFAINGGQDAFTLQGVGQSVKLVLVTTTGH